MFRHTTREVPVDEHHKQRLLEKVTVGEKEDDCWSWNASVNDHGYGRIRIHNEEYVASRLSYAVHAGRDPAHLDVCHSCNNPSCTNPRHLFLGNHLENMQHASLTGRWDGKGKGVSRNVGEKNPRAKLTDIQVAEILRLYAEGAASQKSIAERFGVTQGYVSGLVCNSRRSTAVSDHREILQNRYG